MIANLSPTTFAAGLVGLYCLCLAGAWALCRMARIADDRAAEFPSWREQEREEADCE